MLVQLAAERTGFHPVSRTVFRPRPNVDSALVAFRRRPLPDGFADVKRVVEAAFAHRRKTLPNSLELAGLATRARAQEALAALGRPRGHARRGARAGRVRRARAAAPMSDGSRHAKINLALVVGPVGASGKHELTTVFQRVDLADRLELEPASALAVEGFEDDTLVGGALEALARAAAVEPAWRVRIEKEIPVAAGLGGGSSDAAAALALANETLDQPLPPERLHDLAARLGADVPFFLAAGPQLGEGDGTRLTPVELPQGRTVVLVLPGRRGEGVDRVGLRGVRRAERRGRLRRAPRSACWPRSPPATSPPCRRTTLRPRRSPPSSSELGAFRADVSGAGPAVYGLFADEAAAAEAGRGLGAPRLGLDRRRRRGRLRA